jgi:xylulokinase
VIGWQDSRGGPWDRELTARMGAAWFARHTGFPKSSSAVGQLLRLRAQGALPGAYSVGWVGDVIVGRLCGRRAHDGTSLSEACLFNPAGGQEDQELLAILGIGKESLPELLSVDQAAGGLLPGVAQVLGLSAGIPVGPAVHDQYAAATGCGAVRSGDTMLGAGTAWVLLAMSATLDPPVGGIALVGRHPVAGIFGQMLSMVNGGACITWASKTLNLGSIGVKETDELLSGVPAGSDGLRFRPLLSEIGGAGLPRGTAGRMDGLRLGHTPGHIMRALTEGLACELGRYLLMVGESGAHVGRLVMCGKAAASTITPGIVADTTGLPVDCVTIPETSSLGAAMFARALVEPDAGLVGLSDGMKPPMRRVQPGPGTSEARARLEEYLRSFEAMTA